MVRVVRLVPHNSDWPARFEREAGLLSSALGNTVIAIHHIGSTAIPGIVAKPVIDILLVLTDLDILDEYTMQFGELGYTALGEYGIPGRRFFIKGSGERSHHIHAFAEDSPHIARHLRFRDYLLSHPSIAKEYEALKLDLAVKFAEEPEQYAEAKTDFIREIERMAMEERTLRH